jgi:hypothetical protein
MKSNMAIWNYVLIGLLVVSTAAGSLQEPMAAEESGIWAQDDKGMLSQVDTKDSATRYSILRAVVFRVYDPNGAPVDKAEILIQTTTPKVTIPPKLARGRTVIGLWQTFVPCSKPGYPSQILYKYEIWSAAGKTYKGYWWQSTNSWVCDETKDITVKLKPIDKRESRFPDQVMELKPSKEYAPIVPGAKKGDLPKVKVSLLTFNSRAKKGKIPFEITPSGFWKSRKTLAKTTYNFIEFDSKSPAHMTEIGEPCIPMKSIVVAIPANAALDKVILKPKLIKTVKNLNLYPNQEPRPLLEEKFYLAKEKVMVNKDLYKRKAAYPGKFYEVITTGYFGSYKVVVLKTFPAQFHPADKQVKFYKLTGAIQFKADEIKTAAKKRRVLKEYEKTIDSLILNAGDARKWEGYQRKIGKRLQNAFKAMPMVMPEEMKKEARNYFPCVIICADSFLNQANDLAFHHTGKGFPTIIAPVSSIDKNIPGRDLPDKIRNYIRFLHYQYMTGFAILFGDVNSIGGANTVVPSRWVWDPKPLSGVDNGVIPCDYYYGCLDGNWNADNDNIYGEAADYPDLFFEVIVGRLPANNTADAISVVNIIKNYENNPPPWKGILLAANDLNWNSFEVKFKESVYLNPVLISLGFSPHIFRMYEGWGNLNPLDFSNFVNKGIDFIQYFGHGTPGSTQLMSSWQVEQMIWPTHNMPVVFALSCSTARFDDTECFGETWVEKIRASAYIGATRVAYTYTDGPFAAAAGLDIRFIQNYAWLKRTGSALDLAKCQLFATYGWNEYTTKTIYEFTLLGDPLMLHVVRGYW